MAKCHACSADVTFLVNQKTTKTVPLVPFDEAFPKAHRYRIVAEDPRFCVRDDEGPMMSHFANCTNPRNFSGRNKLSIPTIEVKGS